MVFWSQFSTEEKQSRFNIQRRTINPESNFNPGQNYLLHKNRSPLCVVLSASAPLWRSYAAPQTYHQWWLISSINQYISQPCTFLLVSTPLFRSPVSPIQKYVNCYSEVFCCLQVQITTLCISISLSATVALVCLFTPKMYIIVFQPEKNVRRLTMNSASYKKPATNTSSVLGANNHGNIIFVHFSPWYKQQFHKQTCM